MTTSKLKLIINKRMRFEIGLKNALKDFHWITLVILLEVPQMVSEQKVQMWTFALLWITKRFAEGLAVI